MDSDVAAKLAENCMPAWQTKGLSQISSIEQVESRRIQGVWTGNGGIAELRVHGAGGAKFSVVAKSIGSYRGCDPMGLQDHWSYYNEASFYESNLPDLICSAGALCPQPLFVTRKASSGTQSNRGASKPGDGRLERLLRRHKVLTDGEGEKDEAIICMTALSGGRWSPPRTEAALVWLARLHALFWGNARADKAVAAGVSDQAGFWHLENRAIELGRMSSKSPLRLAAAAIDARLKADSMQTMCHGDPKGANIMHDDEHGVSMYDFQWFGKAPPTKDLAYFFATAAMNGGRWDRAKEESLLRFYHVELCKLLEAQGDEKPSFEKLYNTYKLAVVDYHRWIEGGFPWGNMALIGGHTDEFFNTLKSGGKPLDTEADYHARIFECFPP
eukprot:TRINITY_DN24456_c0_g1_i1.p1 TRINITY_DN24456_c0_g1~~TRINITY_DN24456_c0_g1_i1.p1  ORF type:complete len:405 (+),score=57.63 TRINITY_DN24456_c0_g1_i1:60-1217(+)